MHNRSRPHHLVPSCMCATARRVIDQAEQWSVRETYLPQARRLKTITGHRMSDREKGERTDEGSHAEARSTQSSIFSAISAPPREPELRSPRQTACGTAQSPC